MVFRISRNLLIIQYKKYLRQDAHLILKDNVHLKGNILQNYTRHFGEKVQKTNNCLLQNKVKRLIGDFI